MTAAPARGAAPAYAAMALLSLVWGYTWVVVKIASADATPLALAALRVGIGVVTLFAILAVTRRPLGPPPFVPTLRLGLVQTLGFTALQTFAVAAGGAGKSAILAYTMPFWVALIAWPRLGERIAGASRWTSLGLAALGLGLVLYPLDLAHGLVPGALAVSAGLVWAFGAVETKVLRGRYPTDLLNVTAWQMLYGAVPLAILALATPQHVAWTGSFTAAILYMGVLGMGVAWLIWMFVLSRLPAGVAGIASLATPVVSVVTAAVQLHEIPSAAETAGIVAIVAALIVNSR